MPEIEIINYHGLSIRISSDDEELLKVKNNFENIFASNLEYRYSKISSHADIQITINSYEFRETFMSMFEYVNFDLVLDASNLPDNINFYMKIFGYIKPLPHGADVVKTSTFHFTFDERGDKARIYDNYKMCDIDPKWMIYRAIQFKDNKFIKWVISSYPDDVNDWCYLSEAICNDNAEAFHLFEQNTDEVEKDISVIKLLIMNSESYGHPEYAEYLRNHYLEE